jgi:hypothetical protein
MRRTPMRRTAWNRKVAPSPARAQVSETIHPLALMELAPVAIKAVAKCRAVMAKIGSMVDVACPKPEAHRNPALLAMAEGKPCLLRVPGQCVGGTDTTVACHSNWKEHGKAGARKADDEYSVWGCFGCHHWLDRIAAPKATKQASFMRAHADQVLEWRRIAQDSSEKPRDRKAALWALEKLNVSPALAIIA